MHYMNKDHLSVREIKEQDIEAITNYWLGADSKHMEAMGVDITKLPSREDWYSMLSAQLNQSYEEKKSYCIIWEINGVASGHSNINKIQFAEEAYMHLHLWKNDTRTKGLGTAFVKMTIPYYFNNYALNTLYCEPYALNPAPNKTLQKAGFEFVKKYTTIPGWLNFEQEVNLWQLTKQQYEAMLIT